MRPTETDSRKSSSLINTISPALPGQTRMVLSSTPLPALVDADETVRWKKLGELIRQRRITDLVLGYPYNMDGSVGFKAKEVTSFGDALDAQLASTKLVTTTANQIEGTSPVDPNVTDTRDLSMRRDGNNVQMDRELLTMTKASAAGMMWVSRPSSRAAWELSPGPHGTIPARGRARRS